MSNTISSNALSSILASGTPTSLGGVTTNTNQSNLSIAGLASGMDWSTVIAELAQAERSPETAWEQQITSLNSQNSAYSTISNDLTTLQTDIETLQDTSLYSNTSVTSSSSSVATATSNSDAAPGSYTFNITQLATAAQINGATGVAQAISPTNDPSSVTIGTAGFGSRVTAGTFTVDGAQVSIATTDSLQDVFNAISTATSGKVTASYSSSTDEITLASSDSSPIVLGSAADTSNFLQVAQLYNNNTGTVSSSSALGHVQVSATMTGADLSTAITDGGSGQGAFTINGVTINYDASTESIQNVLNSINGSAAGVTATYNANTNSFTLKNNTTGDVGISMQDVTGNFLAATGLSGGTLQSGKNLLYTLNGGSQQLVSQSNTITSASSSIAGLTVTALQTGSATMNVSTDTSGLSTAIQQFVTDYNSLQTLLTNDSAVTTSSSGTVTPGVLTGDLTAAGLASGLRQMAGTSVPGLSSAISFLSDLGVTSNGKNNTLSVDTTTLNNALATSLNSVQSFFNDSTNGLATKFNNFINNAIGLNGTVANHQATLSQQVTSLNTQISNLETKISNDSATWTSEFEAMEVAKSQTTQELTYLSQQVSSGQL